MVHCLAKTHSSSFVNGKGLWVYNHTVVYLGAFNSD